MTRHAPTLAAFGLALALDVTGLYAAPALHHDARVEQRADRQTADFNAWLEIDTQAFEDNIATLKQQIGKDGPRICAVMKADAYGNGIDLLIPSIIKTQIPCIGIGSNEEARTARAHGYKGAIVRIRAATLDEIREGRRYDIEELLGDLSQAQAISQMVGTKGKPLRFHLALNSAGMDRNGIDMTTEQGCQEAIRITQLPGLKPVGIMTHFPDENIKTVRRNLAQFKRDVSWLIDKTGLPREQIIVHAANSFATLAVPESRLDMIRPGGLLYGDTIPEHTEYKKIMTFKSAVASINHYPKGSTVGYDRTFTLKRDSQLANLPLGYSDGYRRVFTNKGFVLIHGHRVPVVGKVSMNTTMVDVTDFPDIQEGDEVVLFGKQGNSEITQAEIEAINGALLADLYTVWGNSNPKIKKPRP
ncbi:MAG: alanine racemase [Lautropia sp.]|nr:alanine racemase [Lautropia sp.]